MKDIQSSIDANMLKIFSNSKYIQDRVIYSKNQDKNQALMTDTLSTVKDNFEKNNKSLLGDISLQKRSIMINNYYHKKYKTQTMLLYFIIKVCLFIIAATLINSKFPFLLPDIAYNVLVGPTFAISLIYIVTQLYDIIRRDDMIFDEYKITMNKSSKDDEYDPENQDTSDDSECLTQEVIKD